MGPSSWTAGWRVFQPGMFCAASFHMEAMMKPDLAVQAGGMARWSLG